MFANLNGTVAPRVVPKLTACATRKVPEAEVALGVWYQPKVQQFIRLDGTCERAWGSRWWVGGVENRWEGG